MFIESIPGLYVRYIDRWTFVGWDMSKVALEACKIKDQKAEKKAEKAALTREELDKRWKKTVKPHHEYMKTYTAPSGPLKLEHPEGSYLLKSEDFEEYNSYDETMKLDIQPQWNTHGVIAAFEVALLEETMLLDLSSDSLELLRQDIEYDSGGSAFESQSDDKYSYGEKRKATESPDGKSSKRRLTKTPKPNRVYLLWGGREKGEGEILLDVDYSNNSHIGHMDFDTSMATAQGELFCPAIFSGDKVYFSIYKCATAPSRDPDNWNEFCDEQHMYERRGRF